MAEKIRTYNEERQLQALESNKGLKCTKRKQCLGKNNITTLKEDDGSLIQDFERMIQRCEELYTTSSRQTRQPTTNVSIVSHDKRPPQILPLEVSAAIKRPKRDKAPGEDNITPGVLQDEGEPIVEALTKLFNRCFRDGKVPSCWKNASVVLIQKKGDTADTQKTTYPSAFYQ